jgi:UDP-GlcNAc:undecaprenyl-phosphate GlcNAc-1-phosphate transferase
MRTEIGLGAAFGASMLVALISTPLAARTAHRLRFYDRPSDLSYKIHDRPTPYLGGTAIVTAVAFGVIAGGGPSDVAPVLIGIVVLCGLGTLDDRRPVTIGRRLFTEGIIAVLLWSSGWGWSLFESDIANLCLTIVWVIGVVNSVNVIDNMDGVTATISAASALGIASLAMIEGTDSVAVWALALCGACAGFLPYNARAPARLFLGDGGTLPIGLILATLVMAVPTDQGLAWVGIVPAVLFVGVPVFNAFLVTVSRVSHGISPLTGGQDSITHWLSARVGSAKGVALTLGAAQIGLSVAAVAIATHPLDQAQGLVVVTSSALLAIVVVALVESSRAATTPVSERRAPQRPTVILLRREPADYESSRTDIPTAHHSKSLAPGPE